MIPIILILLAISAAIAFYVGVVRNTYVLFYRIDLAQKVYEASNHDLDQGRPWFWRWNTLKSVPQLEMVFRFWKPLDSFYPDKSFIETE